MSNDKAALALHSVVELHQWIETVFTGSEGWQPALERLLGSFSPSFSMVTIQGAEIGFADVEQLFRNNIGTRPQLRITLDHGHILQQNASSVICRYREIHREGDAERVRWSVAMIDFPHGEPRWCFLQETVVSA